MNVHLSKHGAGNALVLFHGWGFDSQVWHHLIEPFTMPRSGFSPTPGNSSTSCDLFAGSTNPDASSVPANMSQDVEKLGSVDNWSTILAMPTFRGLSAESIAPADKPRGVGFVMNCQQTLELILVDLPGFGKTPLMPWGDFKSSLLEQLPRTFALAGWSLGGLYATRLAIEMPEKVSHLVNITSSPRFIMEPEWPGVKKEVFSTFHRNIAQSPHKTLMEFIELQAGRAKMKNISIPDLAALEHGLNIIETWDLRTELSQLEVPSCFMFGRLDPITPIQIMQTMQTLYPQFKYLLFKKSAHMPFFSQQDEFIHEFMEFMQ